MTTQQPPRKSLKERTREAMKEEVSGVAFRLFATKGFDSVTIAEIAREAGISPRSFFRYFPTKEDVVLGDLADSAEVVRAALSARPREESAWEALGHALGALASRPTYASNDVESMARVILGTPSIRSRELEKYQYWEDLLLPGVTERLGVEPGSPEQRGDQARVLIGAAMVCLRIATQRWLATHGAIDPVATLDGLLKTVRGDAPAEQAL